MRYTIKCDECGKTFLAESQTFGKVKYRCPYCGKILTCRIDAMTGKRVKVRSVVPVTSRSQTFDKSGKPLPLVPVVVEKAAAAAPNTSSLASNPSSLASNAPAVSSSDEAVMAGSKQSDKPRSSFFKRLWRGFLWILHHSKTCLYWSSDRISRFRERYEDADLWLFFGFSVLFIISVILGLFVFAELTKLLVSGQSWLFKTYLQIIHW